MDPRILQRRIDFQRSSGRRRLHLLLAGVAVLGTLGGAVALLHSPIFGVRHLDLTGADHVTRTEVASVAKVGPDTPLVDVNTQRAEAALESIPWVSQAVVRRQWPGTLHISLVDRVPVVQVQTMGGAWGEADATGKVLATSLTPWPDLVKLTGFGNAGPAGSTLSGAGAALRVAVAMPALVRAHVTAMTGQAGAEVSLDLVGGGNVEMGTATEVTAKMAALSTVLAQVDLSGVQTIDVQVPEAPTLTRG